MLAVLLGVAVGACGGREVGVGTNPPTSVTTNPDTFSATTSSSMSTISTSVTYGNRCGATGQVCAFPICGTNGYGTTCVAIGQSCPDAPACPGDSGVFDATVSDAGPRDSAGDASVSAIDAVAGTDGAAVSRAYVSATLSEAGGMCTFSLQQILSVGAGTQGQLPVRASDGAIQGGEKVHVTCTVTSNSSGGFNLALSAIQDGSNGGSMTITGMVDSNANGSGLTGSFVYAGIDLQDTSCTMTATYYGQPPPISGNPVAPGRIFAHVDCPTAVAQQGQSQTCHAAADFVFEDCGS